MFLCASASAWQSGKRDIFLRLRPGPVKGTCFLFLAREVVSSGRELLVWGSLLWLGKPEKE